MMFSVRGKRRFQKIIFLGGKIQFLTKISTFLWKNFSELDFLIFLTLKTVPFQQVKTRQKKTTKLGSINLFPVARERQGSEVAANCRV